MGSDFPLVLNHVYESYDIGATLPSATPGEAITPIPPPSGS